MNLKELEKISKKRIEKTGHHPPNMFIESEKGLEIYALMFENHEQKEKIIKGLREMISVRNIQTYMVVFEGWISKRKPLEKVIRPSEDPERCEVLILSQYNKDNTFETIIDEFSRKGDKIVWGERTTSTDLQEQHSIWNFYLEDVGDEKFQASRWEEFLKEIPNFEKDFDKYIEKMWKSFPRDNGMDKEEFKKMMHKKAKKMIKEGRVYREKKK